MPMRAVTTAAVNSGVRLRMLSLGADPNSANHVVSMLLTRDGFPESINEF